MVVSREKDNRFKPFYDNEKTICAIKHLTE